MTFQLSFTKLWQIFFSFSKFWFLFTLHMDTENVRVLTLSHDMLERTHVPCVLCSASKSAPKFKFEWKFPFQDRKFEQEMEYDIFLAKNQVFKWDKATFNVKNLIFVPWSLWLEVWISKLPALDHENCRSTKKGLSREVLIFKPLIKLYKTTGGETLISGDAW